jgi:hypothetical protein
MSNPSRTSFSTAEGLNSAWARTVVIRAHLSAQNILQVAGWNQACKNISAAAQSVKKLHSIRRCDHRGKSESELKPLSQLPSPQSSLVSQYQTLVPRRDIAAQRPGYNPAPVSIPRTFPALFHQQHLLNIREACRLDLVEVDS